MGGLRCSSNPTRQQTNGSILLSSYKPCLFEWRPSFLRPEYAPAFQSSQIKFLLQVGLHSDISCLAGTLRILFSFSYLRETELDEGKTYTTRMPAS